MTRRRAKPGLLWGARVYLSGPMDFVASREDEMKYGWRSRLSRFLTHLGVIVFDPWFKPEVLGRHKYGAEKPGSQVGVKQRWTFDSSRKGSQARARCARDFWPTMHIDLRMVDTSDFTIAYCPTSVYSVGTVHEIVTARLQHKPVLLVSPPAEFPTLEQLRAYVATDPRARALLEKLEKEVPIVPNPGGIPSAWYMPLLGEHSFFDGFGFARYRRTFGWKSGPLDDREQRCRPERPLLPFLRSLNEKLPRKYDLKRRRFVKDDDWLLWDLRRTHRLQ